MSHPFKLFLSSNLNTKIIPSKEKVRTMITLGSYYTVWCGRRDLNPHESLHWNLKPARLPIPPRPHINFVPFSKPRLLYHKML